MAFYDCQEKEMRQVFLNRIYRTKGVTIGMMRDDSNLYALTLENPWVGNETNISCIPEGNYVCEIDKSPKYGDVYHVRKVEGRSHILIHWGNYERNTEGCILLGKGLMWDTKDNKEAISQSKETIKSFMESLNREHFLLTIRGV